MAEHRPVLWALALAAVLLQPEARADRPRNAPALPRGKLAFHTAGLGTIRGFTIGPIESALHPNKGYGSAAYERTLDEVRRLGGTWVSLTPFGRVWDLSPSGVSLRFEARFAENERAVRRAIEQAHARGLKVMLVPHLWVESGGWRGEIDPGDDEAWARWADGYRAFVMTWAKVARDARVEMFSVGVELRTWVTSSHAPSFVSIIRAVRQIYPGLLTYAANWDDVSRTVILGELDVIGVNAFYPLTEKPGATLPDLLAGGRAVMQRVRELAELWDKPVMFTEFGYTTRTDPALRPWEWPDTMSQVTVDELAQADAYRGLLAPLIDEPRFAGMFMWRLYADPDDMSQEAEWGFSPRGKLAELVLRDAYAAHWAGDGPRPLGAALHRHAAERVGVY